MGGRGASSTNNHVIAVLEGAVSGASTINLQTAYNQLAKKDRAKMTNEEKQVRAVIIDELMGRNKMVYDRGTGEYKTTSEKNIINIGDTTYRISKVHTESYGGPDIRVADAWFLSNGKWIEVKNVQRRKQLAALFKGK